MCYTYHVDTCSDDEQRHQHHGKDHGNEGKVNIVKVSQTANNQSGHFWHHVENGETDLFIAKRSSVDGACYGKYNNGAEDFLPFQVKRARDADAKEGDCELSEKYQWHRYGQKTFTGRVVRDIFLVGSGIFDGGGLVLDIGFARKGADQWNGKLLVGGIVHQ